MARDGARLHALIDDMGDAIVKPLDGMGGSGHRLALLHELNRVTRDTAIVSSRGDAGGREFAAAGFRILGQLDFLPFNSTRRLYVLRKFEL